MTLALTFHRGLHKRPGGWTPKELGTLSLWLDADDATTITIATGVSQWDDKSGNSRHFSQSTGANQPAYVTGAQNGRAALRFTAASNMNLRGGDTLDLGTGGISVMAVSGLTTAAAPILAKSTNTVDAAGEWGLNASSAVYVTASGTGSVGITQSSSLRLIGMVIDRATALTVYANGSSLGTSTTGSGNTDSLNTSSPLVIGARLAGGTTPTGGAAGDLGEIVASLAAWTTDDRQKVEGYLAHKWGLAGSLPSDHPYKSVAP